MKKLLKYLLPLIAITVFCNCADRSASVVPEDQAADLLIGYDMRDSGISATDAEICLPRQVSFGNTSRLQSAPRRTTGTHRNNVEFARSGKIVNADLRYFIQRKSIIIHSPLVEPAHKLLYLGKLII